MADPNVSNLSSVFDDEDGKEEDEAKKTEVNGNKRKASNLVHGFEINLKDSASDFEEEEAGKPKVTRTNWPRQVRELILDSDSWSQGVKGQAFRVPGGQG